MSTPCEGVTDLWSLTEVTCNYADFKVKVPKCVFDETIFDGSPLTELLKDDLFISGAARPGTKCFGKIDDADKFVFFDVGKNPDTCQVRREPRTYTDRPNHNKVLEYSANIQYSIGSENSVISRTRSINLPFFCHFPLDFKVSEDTKLKAKRQEIRYKVKGEVVTTEIVSGLFKDETWDTQLTGDQVFEVPTPIHVGFSTPNDSDKFKIKLKKCWATPESNPNHDTKYVFLDNWCGKKAELDGKTLEVYNLEHAAGFAIEAFTWKDQTCSDIFLHCEIELCLVGQDCDTAPVCPKDRKRRETEEKKTVVGGNKVRVCGDATFPLKEKKFNCPKELELQFPTKSEAEGTYEWIEDENEYRKKGSHWAIFKRENGAKTDWVVRFGTGMFYQATGDCPVSDEYLDIEKQVKAQGFKVIAKGGKEEEKKTCPEKVDLKWPKSGNPGIEGTYTLDKNDKSYRKPNSDWSFKLVQEDYWIHKADLPKFSTEGNCPVSDSYKNTLMQPVTGLEVTEHKEEEEEEKSDKKECPLEVQVEFPDFPDMEGVYVRGELTKNYVKAGSKWSIISNNGAMVFVKDGSGVYGSSGDCPVGLLYANNDRVDIPKLKVTAKEEKKVKEEERKLEKITCPEKVDLKWPKSQTEGSDIEGTYILDTQDMSYHKPNSNWAIKLDMSDYVIHQGDTALFSIVAKCPIGDSYKSLVTNKPITGLEVTEHKKEEEQECPGKLTVEWDDRSQPNHAKVVGEYTFVEDTNEYLGPDLKIVKRGEEWRLTDGNIITYKIAQVCPNGAKVIDLSSKPVETTIKISKSCPDKVELSGASGPDGVNGIYTYDETDKKYYQDDKVWRISKWTDRKTGETNWEVGKAGVSSFGAQSECPNGASYTDEYGTNFESVVVKEFVPLEVECLDQVSVSFDKTTDSFDSDQYNGVYTLDPVSGFYINSGGNKFEKKHNGQKFDWRLVSWKTGSEAIFRSNEPASCLHEVTSWFGTVPGSGQIKVGEQEKCLNTVQIRFEGGPTGINGRYEFDDFTEGYLNFGSAFQIRKEDSKWKVMEGSTSLYVAESNCPVGAEYKKATGELDTRLQVTKPGCSSQIEVTEFDVTDTEMKNNYEGNYFWIEADSKYENERTDAEIVLEEDQWKFTINGVVTHYADGSDGNCPVWNPFYRVGTDVEEEGVDINNVAPKEVKPEPKCLSQVFVNLPDAEVGVYSYDVTTKKYSKDGANWVLEWDGAKSEPGWVIFDTSADPKLPKYEFDPSESEFVCPDGEDFKAVSDDSLVEEVKVCPMRIELDLLDEDNNYALDYKMRGKKFVFKYDLTKEKYIDEDGVMQVYWDDTEGGWVIFDSEEDFILYVNTNGNACPHGETSFSDEADEYDSDISELEFTAYDYQL